jgi:energy-converting hydrogenase Eha subunit A
MGVGVGSTDEIRGKSEISLLVTPLFRLFRHGVGDGLMDFVQLIGARRNRDLNALITVYHAEQFRSADARCLPTGALFPLIRMGLSMPTPRNDFRHVRKSFVKSAIVLSPLLALALTVVSCPATEETGVSHCYLTWKGDTSTTMTVNFHSEFTTDSAFVYYDTVPRLRNADNYSAASNCRLSPPLFAPKEPCLRTNAGRAGPRRAYSCL